MATRIEAGDARFAGHGGDPETRFVHQASSDSESPPPTRSRRLRLGVADSDTESPTGRPFQSYLRVTTGTSPIRVTYRSAPSSQPQFRVPSTTPSATAAAPPPPPTHICQFEKKKKVSDETDSKKIRDDEVHQSRSTKTMQVNLEKHGSMRLTHGCIYLQNGIAHDAVGHFKILSERRRSMLANWQIRKA